MVRVGLEPGTSGIQVRQPNHSAILIPEYCVQYLYAYSVIIYVAVQFYP